MYCLIAVINTAANQALHCRNDGSTRRTFFANLRPYGQRPGDNCLAGLTTLVGLIGRLTNTTVDKVTCDRRICMHADSQGVGGCTMYIASFRTETNDAMSIMYKCQWGIR